eukprot:gene4260-3081_t
MSGQSAIGTRARRDPHRRTGNANAVAAGVDLTQVGVVSERELNWIRRLANETEGDVDAYLKKEEERRKALSAARTSRWTDTKEAKHGEFLRSQAAAVEEAERRRQELDALFEEQEREAHRARVAQLELQQLKEDPRGRNIQHMLMLHDAIKGREEQIAFKKTKAADVIEEQRREVEEMQRKAWGEEAEERRKNLVRIQKNVEEKTTNLDAVMYQLDKRKQERREEKAGRVVVDREALEEKLENEEEERIRKKKEYETGMWNKEHSRKAVTKHDRLNERIEEYKIIEAERLKEEDRMRRRREMIEAKRRKKQEEFERCKELGKEAYLREGGGGPSPVYRTQDAFVNKGINFMDKLAEENDARAAKTQEELIKSKNYEPDRHHRPAEASASGFRSMEEELAYLEEMRELPAKMKAEEAEMEALRRQRADRIARIQKMQAAEKKTHERLLTEKERQDTQLQRAHLEEDDKKYVEYLRSQIPADMDPAFILSNEKPKCRTPFIIELHMLLGPVFPLRTKCVHISYSTREPSVSRIATHKTTIQDRVCHSNELMRGTMYTTGCFGISRSDSHPNERERGRAQGDPLAAIATVGITWNVRDCSSLFFVSDHLLLDHHS